MPNPKISKAPPSLPQKLWNEFSSMKFAIVILVLLAVLSVISLFIGEFYPVQAFGPGWQEYWRQQLGWSQPVFDLFLFFHLHDPFRSWWYRILLLVLSLSLLTCIIDRLSPALRALKIGAFRDGAQIKALPFFREFKVLEPARDVLKRLPHGLRFKKQESGSGWRVVGVKGALSYWGPILTHAGLLLLAGGGLVASLLGFSTRVQGLPGDVINDPGIDFSVRIDTFMIQYYPLLVGQYVLVDDTYIGKIVKREDDDHFLVETMDSSQPQQAISVEKNRLRNQYDIEFDRSNIKDYITVATILDEGRKNDPVRIEVNHPLRYRGYRFYQSSFNTEKARVTASIDSAVIQILTPDGAVLDTVVISADRPHRLPDGSELILAQFLPDFRIDGSTPTSASSHLHNPAVKLDVRKDGATLYHQWTFLKNPFRHTSPDANYAFQVLNIFGFKGSSVYATILQVKKNPGYMFIWAGFVLATLGLLLSFYLTPQRFYLTIQEGASGHSEVIAGGTTKRSPDLFSQKFDHWVDRLQNRSGKTKQ